MSYPLFNIGNCLFRYLSYNSILCILFCYSYLAAAYELPGMEPIPQQFQSKLKKSRLAKGEGYQPRTEHIREDGSPHYTNRLILEDSPYLLQHAHNPVNWYAWGEEAFEQARRQNKPIFLSIGYSTCHWCHVMEKESFESIEVSRYLNTHFIAIKVDRERRPHVDELYMTALLLLKGQGGWPMSSFLFANGKSFYGGTYYPKNEFLHLLRQIVDSWDNEQEKLVAFANEIAEAVEVDMRLQHDIDSDIKPLVQLGVRQIMSSYDRQWGGFGHSTKFPNEASLMFLFQAGFRNQDSEILDAVEQTLMMMSHGGIYDHLAGGFHRYSTDPYWLVPHFEKMLYNQASLSRLYAQVYRINNNSHLKRVAEQTLDYVLRDWRSPSGGFYSATDADSDSGEGSYFTWGLDEMKTLLGEESAQFVKLVYGMSDEGNFEGRNILYLPQTYEDAAKVINMNESAVLNKLNKINQKLLEARHLREPPLQDKKIIVAWNSMMVTALVEASVYLDKPDYLEAAIRTTEFIWLQQRREDGSLWRIHYQGSSSIVAIQNDYALFAEALIALYDATGEQHWLIKAQEIVTQMIGRFADNENGGFYMNEDRRLFYIAPRKIRDGALPSGNAVAVQVLIDLAKRTQNRQYEKLAKQTLQNFAVSIKMESNAYPSMLSAMNILSDGDIGPIEYSSGGIVRASAEVSISNENNTSVSLSIHIAEGWHINSNKPFQDYLIPLQIETSEQNKVQQLGKLVFPEPIFKKLLFEDMKLSLYEGNLQIGIDVERAMPFESFDERRLDIYLTLQACNTEICLLPEEMILELITP
jgi:uncharacterized protein